MKQTSVTTAITAKTLTPFYYHGLYARDGSTTYPNIITDTAFLFALQTTLLSQRPALRDKPDYKADLAKIHWRASLLMGKGNEMTPPVRHTIDVEREGGNHESMQKCMGSGNFKKTFFVHEVAAGATYQGVLYGIDPFKLLEPKTDSFIIRVGVGRSGMLEISRNRDLKEVRLNTATAKLFGRSLTEEYRILDTIRVSKLFPVKEAIQELEYWC